MHRHNTMNWSRALTAAVVVGIGGLLSAVAVHAQGGGGNVSGSAGGHTPVTLCHWVPADAGSYITITVDDDGANGNVNLQGHAGHEHDIIPAPPTGCPSGATSTAGAGGTVTPVATETPSGGTNGHTPVTLCHWVPAHGGSYITITVDDDGANGNVNLQGHAGHEHDIIPAPAGGCPSGATSTAGAGETVTPAATETPSGEINGHTPVTLCHWVPAHGGSYITITVDDDGANGNVNLQGHAGHEHDIIPAPAGGCPGVTATPEVSVTAVVSATASVSATAAVSATASVEATNTVEATQTTSPTASPQATNTVEATQTASATASPAATNTVEATQTASATASPAATNTTVPATSTATGGAGADTATPTNTAVAATATPTASGGAGAVVATPTRTQGVLGAQTQPSAARPNALPSAGDGSSDAPSYVAAMIVLMLTGAGMVAAALYRRRA